MRFIPCSGATSRPSGQRPVHFHAFVVFADRACATLVYMAMLALAGLWIAAAIEPAQAAPRTLAPITIIAGTPEETSLAIANDLAALGETSRTRILAVVGRGSLANISDLTELDSIDAAITQTDALEHLKTAGTLGSGLDRRIGIIARLHDAELHILAGQGIERIEDLAGKTVNLCSSGSATEFTARVVLDRLSIKVRSINVSHRAGLAKVASGEIAATMLVTGKPAAAIEGRLLPEGVKLLSVPFPPQLDETYMPTTLTEADYPGLIAHGQRIDTLAVAVVLVAPMTSRSGAPDGRISKVVDMLFSEVATLHMPAYHPKWRDMNLTASMPGWPRHPAVEHWLKSNGAARSREPAPADRSALADAASQLETSAPGFDPMATFAQATRAANGNPAEQERLFRAFLLENRRPQPAQTASSAAAP